MIDLLNRAPSAPGPEPLEDPGLQAALDRIADPEIRNRMRDLLILRGEKTCARSGPTH